MHRGGHGRFEHGAFGNGGRHTCCRPIALFRILGHWRNESVSVPDNSLEASWLLRVIPKSQPELADRRVDALFGVLKYAGAPQPFHNCFPRDQVPTGFGQEHQKIEGNVLNPDRMSRAAQFVTDAIQLKLVKAITRRVHKGWDQRYNLTKNNNLLLQTNLIRS